MTITIDPREMLSAIAAELDASEHDHQDWWRYVAGCARCEIHEAAARLENTIARQERHQVPNADGRAS